MNKVYYSQIDSRWKNHPYPASNGYENKTIGTSGCGPTCAAMVVSAFKDIVYPNQMGDIFRENGFRVPGGTSIDAFPFVAEKWDLEYKRVKSSYEAHQACKEGWYVIINVAEGLWTTGGHYILAVGATDSDIEIFDPYLYAGKFNRYGRSGKVHMNGTSAWINIDTFKAYSNAQRFFCFRGEDIQPIPVPSEGVEKIVNTNSARLNVRNAPNGDIVDKLNKGDHVIVYGEDGGWSMIGESRWVASEYLIDAYSPAAPDRDTIGEMRRFAQPTIIYSRSDLSGNTYNYKANTTVTILDNINDTVDLIRVNQTGREGYIDISAYGEDIAPTPLIPNTVGQTKKLRKATIVYANSNLTGTQYNYKANTTVKILENISSTVDKIKVNMTGRIGYIKNNNYK